MVQDSASELSFDTLFKLVLIYPAHGIRAPDDDAGPVRMHALSGPSLRQLAQPARMLPEGLGPSVLVIVQLSTFAQYAGYRGNRGEVIA